MLPHTSFPAPGRPPAPAIVAATFLLLALVSCARPSPHAGSLPDGTPALVATVVSVTDGDTVELAIGTETERVRLLGIDTPETVKPDSPVECFGPEASARTAELLPPGESVLVVRDQEARDRFGRLLLYVWRQSDGTFVNEALLADGFARTLSIAPNDAYRGQLATAESAARASAAGLWGSCPPED